MESILFDNKYSCLFEQRAEKRRMWLARSGHGAFVWAVMVHLRLKTRANKSCASLYCVQVHWLMLWVWLQVNGHQIMDEPMEEGEPFSHCVSNEGLQNTLYSMCSVLYMHTDCFRAGWRDIQGDSNHSSRKRGLRESWSLSVRTAQSPRPGLIWQGEEKVAHQ